MTNEYKRGEIYFAELDGGVGSEQAGRRPVVIIQNNVGNAYSTTLIVAAVTSGIEGKFKMPTHYHIGRSCGLYKDSVVLLEQIRTIDKSRIIHYIGQVPKKHMRAIDRALGISVDMNKPAYINVCPACAKMLHSTGTFLLIRNGNISEDEMCSCCKMEFAREYEVRLHTK